MEPFVINAWQIRFYSEQERLSSGSVDLLFKSFFTVWAIGWNDFVMIIFFSISRWWRLGDDFGNRLPLFEGIRAENRMEFDSGESTQVSYGHTWAGLEEAGVFDGHCIDDTRGRWKEITWFIHAVLVTKLRQINFSISLLLNNIIFAPILIGLLKGV